MKLKREKNNRENSKVELVLWRKIKWNLSQACEPGSPVENKSV